MMPRMKRREGSIVQVFLVASAVLLAPLSVYAVAYFACTQAMGKRLDDGCPTRVYRTPFEALIFIPAALVETAVTGREVTPGWTP